jgi:hypothetical protein
LQPCILSPTVLSGRAVTPARKCRPLPDVFVKDKGRRGLGRQRDRELNMLQGEMPFSCDVVDSMISI